MVAKRELGGSMTALGRGGSWDELATGLEGIVDEAVKVWCEENGADPSPTHPMQLDVFEIIDRQAGRCPGQSVSVVVRGVFLCCAGIDRQGVVNGRVAR